jgi:hypothetical protein
MKFKRLTTMLAASILTVSLSVLNTSAVDYEGTNIIDHNYATISDLKNIPDEWIENAKKDLHIVYGHTSHGSQIITGMSALYNNLGDLYSFGNDTDGTLDMDDTPSGFGTDLGNSEWASNTRSYLDNHPETNVVMWSWCGQVSWSTEDSINDYLSTMTQLEEDYPQVTFVYMTGHLNGSGVNGNNNLRNEQIRNYCKQNDKMLFDFADIESYDPDGNYYLDKSADDGCNYDSANNGWNDSNWAVNWQNSHTEGVDWFDCSPAHTEALNGNMKAYAAWYMYAVLAGWNDKGTTEPIKGDINGDNILNVADAVSLKKMILTENAFGNTNTDINGDGKVNIFDVINLIKMLRNA